MAGSLPGLPTTRVVPYVGWGRFETTRRHHQQALATARAVCHRSQLELAGQGIRRQRRQGIEVGPLAWFAVQGVIDDHVVRALWSDGRLRGARLLGLGPGCWSTGASSSAATIHHAATMRACRPRPVACC
jgi:hypothetical protein